MIGYLCKSLRIISLVWPTGLIFLAMGEVLSFGFNLVLLDPSDSRGNDTYYIVAIEDKKMGFISYCMSLSLYIVSSCLRRYSVLPTRDPSVLTPTSAASAIGSQRLAWKETASAVASNPRLCEAAVSTS